MKFFAFRSPIPLFHCWAGGCIAVSTGLPGASRHNAVPVPTETAHTGPKQVEHTTTNSNALTGPAQGDRTNKLFRYPCEQLPFVPGRSYLFDTKQSTSRASFSFPLDLSAPRLLFIDFHNKSLIVTLETTRQGAKEQAAAEEGLFAYPPPQTTTC